MLKSSAFIDERIYLIDERVRFLEIVSKSYLNIFFKLER